VDMTTDSCEATESCGEESIRRMTGRHRASFCGAT
jgi:hypothetical protein